MLTAGVTRPVKTLTLLRLLQPSLFHSPLGKREEKDDGSRAAIKRQRPSSPGVYKSVLLLEIIKLGRTPPTQESIQGKRGFSSELINDNKSIIGEETFTVFFFLFVQVPRAVAPSDPATRNVSSA